MKTTLLRTIGALTFGLLFYDQNLGINMLLFAMVAITAVFITQKETRTRKPFIFITSLYLLSAVFVFTVNSLLSITTCIVTFLVFVGSISGKQNSIYVQWLNGIYQSLLGALHNKLDQKETSPSKDDKSNYGFIVLTITIVTTLVILFAGLYSQANPILNSWISKINLEFINIGWVITTLMGYFLLMNITSRAELDVITIPDRKASIILSKKSISESASLSLHLEKRLGVILLSALNGLIIVYIITDIWYILQDPLEDAATLSKTVHEGVNALITSIGVAITTILILFRGNLNFYKKSANLRKLTYLWIAFNIIIILLIAFKNYQYSSGFGLTYKRLGVFIYLALCISGMVTTYFKIARTLNLHFMIRANARVAFIILITMSSFSWNREITAFNLSHVEHPDISYLLKIGETNGDLLHAFAKAHPEKNTDPEGIKQQYKAWRFMLNDQTWQSQTLLNVLNR